MPLSVLTIWEPPGFLGMAVMRGDGQVSRRVTMGALTVIVTGGFSVVFLKVSCCSGLFCEQEKIMEKAINKKHLHIKVWYSMFIGLCIFICRSV